MSSSAFLVRVLPAVILAGLTLGFVLAWVGGDDEDAATTGSELIFACNQTATDTEQAEACYGESFLKIISEAPGVEQGLAEVTRLAARLPYPSPLDRCHTFFHSYDIGERWAASHDIKLADLPSVLPRGRDSGCFRGFAHGVLLGVAPQLDASRPRRSAAEACGYLRDPFDHYTCLHGFGHVLSRTFEGAIREASASCARLAEADAAPCGEGVFHDHSVLLAARGGVSAAGPEYRRRLCLSQPRPVVVACWRYMVRALIPGRPGVGTVRRLCAELDSLSRRGCVLGVSTDAALLSHEETAPLGFCRRLQPSDQLACASAMRVPNFDPKDSVLHVQAMKACTALASSQRQPCIALMAQRLAILTDGKGSMASCSRLPDSSRHSCVTGVIRARGAPVSNFWEG
jgi:hypothetical protein